MLPDHAPLWLRRVCGRFGHHWGHCQGRRVSTLRCSRCGQRKLYPPGVPGNGLTRFDDLIRAVEAREDD